MRKISEQWRQESVENAFNSYWEFYNEFLYERNFIEVFKIFCYKIIMLPQLLEI